MMVQHVYDTALGRNVLEMWKLGGSGLTVDFQVGVALDAMALGGNDDEVDALMMMLMP